MRTRQRLVQGPEPVQVKGAASLFYNEDHTIEDLIGEAIEEACQGKSL